MPTPGIDFQLERRKGLRLGIRRHARLVAITAELAAHEVLRLERRDGLEHFHLFIANGFAIGADGRLHRQVGQDLEQMILHHVADRAGLIVKCAAALHAEILRHRDLHALDVLAIPERLEHRVGEAEEQHVVDGLLSEVMVNAEDALLVERFEQNPVEPLRRGEIACRKVFPR